jgi:hypothetical protein
VVWVKGWAFGADPLEIDCEKCRFFLDGLAGSATRTHLIPLVLRLLWGNLCTAAVDGYVFGSKVETVNAFDFEVLKSGLQAQAIGW